MPRRLTTPLTLEKKSQFLAILTTGGTVKEAAGAVGIPRPQMYVYRDRDARFAAAWQAAEDEGTDVLEAEARRRAVDGVEKPIYHQGVCVGTVWEYSDTLLIFLLKGRRPEKYRDRQDVRHSGNINGTVTVRHEFDYSEYTHLFTEFTHPRSVELDALTADGTAESVDSPHADSEASVLLNGPAT
jgi:hypothetical protein